MHHVNIVSIVLNKSMGIFYGNNTWSKFSLLQKNFTLQNVDTCLQQAHRIVNAGCRVIELHHWDVSAALLFRRFGYQIVTVIRHPLSRLQSSFNYEFVTARKNGDIKHKISDQELQREFDDKFRGWISMQQSPLETMRMLSGCYARHCLSWPSIVADSGRGIGGTSPEWEDVVSFQKV